MGPTHYPTLCILVLFAFSLINLIKQLFYSLPMHLSGTPVRFVESGRKIIGVGRNYAAHAKGISRKDPIHLETDQECCCTSSYHCINSPPLLLLPSIPELKNEVPTK